jgi:D-glutamate N-acetyltransferase
MEIKQPYLLFLGDAPDQLAAKTAFGVMDWRPEWCLGQLRLNGCGADLGLVDMSIEEAAKSDAQTMVVGIVNAGGKFPDHWVASIIDALDAGLDVATGLHIRLRDIPGVAEAARANGRQLHDIRYSDQKFATGQGAKRQGMRLLTVGTDCSVGKKYTSLAIEKEMRARQFNADFRATGQTGILISGRGISIDAVVSDFIAGAAEWVSPENDADHWDIIEGQGSLFHPSFAGVTLGLLHGSQPDAFVVCHEPTRTTMRNVTHPIPTIDQVIERTILEGSLTNPNIRCVGISVFSQAYDDEKARAYLAELETRHSLPATDPVRFGAGPIVDEIQRLYGNKASS